MSRAFRVRTIGLFRKANTLFHMLGPRVLVIVQPEDGNTQGYLSHAEAEWPGIHPLLSALGLSQWNFTGPDDYDTVSYRRRVTPSSVGSLQSEGTEGDRLLTEVIAPYLQDELTPPTGAAPFAEMQPQQLGAARSVRESSAAEPVPRSQVELAIEPERLPTPDLKASRPSRKNGRLAATEEMESRKRHPPPCVEYERKRRAVSSPDNRRRKVPTRSGR